MKTKETEAKEIMNRAVLEYYLVKKGKHLKNFYSLRLQIQQIVLLKTKMELLPFRKMDTH